MADLVGNQASALPSFHAPQHQMVFIPILPTPEILEVTGRAVWLFAQLEYYLVVIYKRAVPGASLPEIVEQRNGDSLGALLNGVRDRGDKNFPGLLHITGNTMLDSVMPQLKTADGLTTIRKRYVHWGCARRVSDSQWILLKSGEETSATQIVQELKQASDAIEKIIVEIENKIPRPL